MNRVERIKTMIHYYIKDNTKYEVVTRRTVEHPIRNELMTINVTFSDSERSMRYNAIATENELGHCYFELNTAFFTGITEDKKEHIEIKGFDLFINNIGESKECAIELSRWYHGELDLDLQEAMNIIVEEGINRMMY